MSVRFFRRARIAPGVTVNFSKGAPSLSLGIRGAHVTLGRSGIRRTVGIPGTGLFWTHLDGNHTGVHTAAHFGGRLVDPLLIVLIVVAVFAILLAVL